MPLNLSTRSSEKAFTSPLRTMIMSDSNTERITSRVHTFTRVAVVDDDEAFLDLICEVLNNNGYSVRGFSSAEKLLELLKAKVDFDVLIIDYRLPNSTGIDLFKKIKSMFIRSPVIFISGAADIPAAVEAMQHGAVHFLEKPFQEEQLFALIDTCAETALSDRREDVEITEFIERYNKLPQSQRRVMDLAVEGLTNKEISARTNLSIRTVDTYRMWVMERMGAESFAELVRKSTLMRKRIRKPTGE